MRIANATQLFENRWLLPRVDAHQPDPRPEWNPRSTNLPRPMSLTSAERGSFCAPGFCQCPWRIVEGILENVTPFYRYEPGTRGPAETGRLIGMTGPGSIPGRVYRVNRDRFWSFAIDIRLNAHCLFCKARRSVSAAPSERESYHSKSLPGHSRS